MASTTASPVLGRDMTEEPQSSMKNDVSVDDDPNAQSSDGDEGWETNLLTLGE